LKDHDNVTPADDLPREGRRTPTEEPCSRHPDGPLFAASLILSAPTFVGLVVQDECDRYWTGEGWTSNWADALKYPYDARHACQMWAEELEAETGRECTTRSLCLVPISLPPA
jgi:hypothetical protein